GATRAKASRRPRASSTRPTGRSTTPDRACGSSTRGSRRSSTSIPAASPTASVPSTRAWSRSTTTRSRCTTTSSPANDACTTTTRRRSTATTPASARRMHTPPRAALAPSCPSGCVRGSAVRPTETRHALSRWCHGRVRRLPGALRPVAVEEDALEIGQERRADLEDARIARAARVERAARRVQVTDRQAAHAARGHHLDRGARPLEAVRRGVTAAEGVHGTEPDHGLEEIVERVRRARRCAPPVDLPALRRPPCAEAARLERDVDAAHRVAADSEDTVPAHGELAPRAHRRAHQHDERGAQRDQAGEDQRAAHPLTPGGGGAPPASRPGGGPSPAR